MANKLTSCALAAGLCMSFIAAARAEGPLPSLTAGDLAQGPYAAMHMRLQKTILKINVPLNRWIGVVRDNLEQAREGGLITKDVEQKVGDGLSGWFAALKDRGYLKGDRLLYAVTPDALRTVVVSAGGQVLVDFTERDPGGRRVVLASYFAPKSDFREPLLRSLVEGNH
jgi:hypothetical protein